MGEKPTLRAALAWKLVVGYSLVLGVWFLVLSERASVRRITHFPEFDIAANLAGG